MSTVETVQITLPAADRELAELRAWKARAIEALEAAEWVNLGYHSLCPVCGADGGPGHHDDCLLAALLTPDGSGS